jgi:hypothetical protein
MEGDVVLIRPMFAMLKDMVGVLGKQQFLIEGLRQSYAGLLAVLSGVGEPAASPKRSVAQDAAIAKAQAEVAYLERLFSGESEPTEGETL